VLNAINSINKYIEKIEDLFVMYVVVIMTAAIFIQVVMRYVFNNSLSWSEEFATFCFMWLTWIGASNGVKKNTHIRILLLVEFIKGKYFKYTMIFIDSIWLLFSIYLVKNGIAMVRMSYVNHRISAALEVPMYIMYSSVVVGGGLMCLGLLSVILNRWKDLSSKEA
jgi:TRAP-type C4-dicarboxylate transport system permease small subunit